MSICNLTVASSLATVRARSDTLTRRSRSAARSSASSVCGLEAPRCSRCVRARGVARARCGPRARARCAHAQKLLSRFLAGRHAVPNGSAPARAGGAREGTRPRGTRPRAQGSCQRGLRKKKYSWIAGKKANSNCAHAFVPTRGWSVGGLVGLVGWLVGALSSRPNPNRLEAQPYSSDYSRVRVMFGVNG